MMAGARNGAKLIIGTLAESLLPSVAREVDQGRRPQRMAKLKRAILYARLRRAHAQGDVDGVEDALEAYWMGGPGDQFHNSFAEARLSVFREHHASAIDALAGLLSASDAPFHRLVEIGCGDGKVLADTMQRLPSIAHAVGLDINAGAIARASADHGDADRLKFINADARQWLIANPEPGTVMLSYGGVLEYFSPDSVDRLIQAISLHRPAAAVLVEPADPGHDMATQPESWAFGSEYSFSHNHRLRLSQAGFRIVFEKETRNYGHRLIVMVGVLD